MVDAEHACAFKLPSRAREASWRMMASIPGHSRLTWDIAISRIRRDMRRSGRSVQGFLAGTNYRERTQTFATDAKAAACWLVRVF